MSTSGSRKKRRGEAAPLSPPTTASSSAASVADSTHTFKSPTSKHADVNEWKESLPDPPLAPRYFYSDITQKDLRPGLSGAMSKGLSRLLKSADTLERERMIAEWIRLGKQAKLCRKKYEKNPDRESCTDTPTCRYYDAIIEEQSMERENECREKYERDKADYICLHDPRCNYYETMLEFHQLRSSNADSSTSKESEEDDAHQILERNVQAFHEQKSKINPLPGEYILIHDGKVLGRSFIEEEMSEKIRSLNPRPKAVYLHHQLNRGERNRDFVEEIICHSQDRQILIDASVSVDIDNSVDISFKVDTGSTLSFVPKCTIDDLTLILSGVTKVWFANMTEDEKGIPLTKYSGYIMLKQSRKRFWLNSIVELNSKKLLGMDFLEKCYFLCDKGHGSFHDL
jgi:hypothetical protein